MWATSAGRPGASASTTSLSGSEPMVVRLLKTGVRVSLPSLWRVTRVATPAVYTTPEPSSRRGRRFPRGLGGCGRGRRRGRGGRARGGCWRDLVDVAQLLGREVAARLLGVDDGAILARVQRLPDADAV